MFEIKLPKNCVWFSIEGADKVGKTTLYERLLPKLQESLVGKYDVCGIPELSNSLTGKAIKGAYEADHFRLEDKHYDAQFGDGLLWLAEQYNQFQIALASIDSATVFLSDRGPHSRRILQEIRISSRYSSLPRSELRDWIDTILKFLPNPSHTLLIQTDFETIKTRMNADKHYTHYMSEANLMFDRLPDSVPSDFTVVDGNRSKEFVCNFSMSAVIKFLSNMT